MCYLSSLNPLKLCFLAVFSSRATANFSSLPKHPYPIEQRIYSKGQLWSFHLELFQPFPYFPFTCKPLNTISSRVQWACYIIPLNPLKSRSLAVFPSRATLTFSSVLNHSWAIGHLVYSGIQWVSFLFNPNPLRPRSFAVFPTWAILTFYSVPGHS